MFKIETTILDLFINELIKRVFKTPNEYMEWFISTKPKTAHKKVLLLVDKLKARGYKVKRFDFNERIHRYILEME